MFNREFVMSKQPEQKVGTRKRYNLDSRVFVKFWQQSDSVQEVADKLSEYLGRPIKRQMVQSRVSEIRRDGVLLKRMSIPKAEKPSVDELKKIAAEALEEYQEGKHNKTHHHGQKVGNTATAEVVVDEGDEETFISVE